MTSWQIVRLFAGTLILVSLALGVPGSPLYLSAWWLALFPGIALVLTVLTLNLLGDALRDALDPRGRER